MSMQTQGQGLPEEIQAFYNLAKDFAAKELADKREKNDKYPFGELFLGSIKSAGEVGFFGVNIPTQFGGVGMGESALASILENLSTADASMAAVVFTNAAAIEIINQASVDSDCSAVYEKLSAQDALPVSFHAYTSIRENEVPAIVSGGTIFGKLGFLSLGGLARYAVVPAQTTDKKYSYYLIDLNAAGVQKSETVFSLGLHACPAADVFLNQVSGVLIGKVGEGEKYFRAMQSRLSIGAAAMSLGIMKGSFAEALQYTKDRFQGGRQIINWSEVRMLLANMAVEIQVGMNCVGWACHQRDTQAFGWEKAARAAAIHVAEMACRATVDGVQLLGGNGYMKDFGQEKRMRDAKQVQCLLGMAPVRKMDLVDQIIKESE
jgi:alkylation response protein AidB-like acyl-CoA dehydrogenase